MANDDKDRDERTPHKSGGGGAVLFPTDADREKAARDAEKIEERKYKKEQASIQRRILWTQIFLVGFGIIGAGVGIWQAEVAQESADTAQSSVLLAQKGERDAGLMNEKTLSQMKGQTKAQTDAATVAQRELDLTNRPWIKITHRIVQPLTFNVDRNLGPTAVMTLEDKIENVGPGVALNVLHWEDIIPVYTDRGQMVIGPKAYAPAHARQDQWCNANRKPQGPNVGNIIFPHSDPLMAYSMVGVTMKQVEAATIKDSSTINGKVAFVLVGCVTYRSPVQPKGSPNHETKFFYELGVPMDDGAWMPYIYPRGAAPQLQIIGFPFGYSAD